MISVTVRPMQMSEMHRNGTVTLCIAIHQIGGGVGLREI